MFKGNKKDCICEKPNGKHKEYCDSFRWYKFLIRASSVKNIRKVIISSWK